MRLKDALDNAIRSLCELKEVEVYRFLYYRKEDNLIILENVKDRTIQLILVSRDLPDRPLKAVLDQAAFRAWLGTLVNNQPAAVQLTDGSLCNFLPGGKENKLVIAKLVHFSQESHQMMTFEVPYRLVASMHSSPFDTDCLLSMDHVHVGCWAKDVVTLHLFRRHVEVATHHTPMVYEAGRYPKWDYAQLSAVAKALVALQPALTL